MATLTVPHNVPTPTQDAVALKKAFDGFGTDEETVIRILGHRNARQRRNIRDTYHQLYNESLIDHLHSELSGDFRKSIILWAYDPCERDAKLAREALEKSKKSVDHIKIIVELACASSPNHLVAVRQAYTSLFQCSIEEDIASIVSPSSLTKLLAALVSSYRCDKEVVDFAISNSEASRLHEAIKTKKIDHDHVNWILSTRNFYQLRATFACYKKTFGNPITQDITSSGCGTLESILKVVICCIESPEIHLAEVIRDAIVGFGTDEDSLTRAIVTRAEIDLRKVKERYQNCYKTSLENAVVGDTSGYYKDFLMTLLGARI